MVRVLGPEGWWCWWFGVSEVVGESLEWVGRALGPDLDDEMLTRGGEGRRLTGNMDLQKGVSVLGFGP